MASTVLALQLALLLPFVHGLIVIIDATVVRESRATLSVVQKYKIRYLNVTYNSSGDLPRGILKLTNGYSFTRSCLLLAGVKVIYMLFLKPASDSYFFAEKAVVLDQGERNYYAEKGGEVDVLLKAIGGSELSSSTFQERRDTLTPVLIRLANYGVAVNVTVKYSAPKQVTSLWWLNGDLVVDGDDGVRTDVNYIYYTTEHNGVRKHLKTASIRIPSAFNVESLQLQFAGKSIDVTISINVVTIASGKSLLKYIPKYEYKVTPNYRVTYNPGDSLSYRSSFKSNDLVRSTWGGFKVEFTSIDDCISPPIIQTKTAESDPEFLAVHTPRREDVYLHYWDYIYAGNPKYKIRYLNVTYNSSGDLPRGILKLTNGYSFTRSCLLLAGVKVTYMLFLTPASDFYFFAEKAVVLDQGERNYYAENGGEVDVLLKAIGGSEVSEIWKEPLYEYPDIRLSRRNQTIEPVADIQRFFEREVYFRFRPVTPEQAGRYLVVATMRSPNGTGTAKANFNINVLNVC